MTSRPVLASPEPVSLVDLLDRVLAKGVVVSGELTLTIADVDLVHLSLRALLCSARPDLFSWTVPEPDQLPGREPHPRAGSEPHPRAWSEPPAGSPPRLPIGSAPSAPGPASEPSGSGRATPGGSGPVSEVER